MGLPSGSRACPGSIVVAGNLSSLPLARGFGLS